jgi:hypothetical protein
MSQHHVSIASPPDRESLVAMIDFNGEQWAEINSESGDVRVELYPRRDGQPWVFDLADAMAAIDVARSRLLG